MCDRFEGGRGTFLLINLSDDFLNFGILFNKCKVNVDLYWIVKNGIIYWKYILKFSVSEVIYFIFL